ncbi:MULTISPECIES: imidazoleglycerol-phosphate dehydratase HisB [unclassified Pseudodesulfovibrio]|uniref:imidazoleglycerol-phosphate dehydratase HisB n=1 Tax=unclassified Pseudodesulfovibrio TaxID=2661612 RepID=UPI000FEBE2EE|nr:MULTISPECIES: imidazoleglycerol-phosphate dehydratase HisB [unclassified Pseudodesulfovibrio]MCJ2162958.1 imidazoleglycerol-phosphate dehydratase HisB [Pseudodesulfovibrio sp. S3-i]RWU06957.1 imidazoleglycerol-phosphate dehydratase HisB [Pseudodesulfovibrio sp. S3]
MRQASVARTTKETDIKLTLNLDGEGVVNVNTGIGFADHMLTLCGFWAGFDLTLSCKGDLEIDSHHSLEDIGLCLGQALAEALGDKQGINRVASAKVPMDEALAEVVLDLSGRPYIVYDDALLPDIIANDEKDVWREFLKSFAYKAGMNLHVKFEYGQNGHHLLEAAFKALGLALAHATTIGRKGVSSTKGSLD